MSAGNYDQVFVEIDGTLMGEATTVDIEITDNDQDVETIAKGYAGTSASPSKMMVSMSLAVNSAGFDKNAFKLFLSKQVVQIRLTLGGSGLSMTSKGRIRAPKMKAGVGATTTEDFQFVGEPAYFQ